MDPHQTNQLDLINLPAISPLDCLDFPEGQHLKPNSNVLLEMVRTPELHQLSGIKQICPNYFKSLISSINLN